MMARMGNEKAQQEIRDLHTKATHCPFLKVDSDACVCLPEHDDLSEKDVGVPCPNYPRMNPKYVPVYESAVASSHLFSEAFYCRDMIELNAVPPTSEIDPTTFEICRVARRYMKTMEQEERIRSLETFLGIFGFAGAMR